MQRQNIQAQEQFLHLDNYRSEWDKPEQLEIFKEQEKAELVKVMAQDPEIKQYPNDIEPLESSEL